MSVDFPRAWEIAKATKMNEHDPKCSYRRFNGGLLCDCHVLTTHTEYVDKSRMFTASGKIFERKSAEVIK